jgi:hypothetical protein
MPCSVTISTQSISETPSVMGIKPFRKTSSMLITMFLWLTCKPNKFLVFCGAGCICEMSFGDDLLPEIQGMRLYFNLHTQASV